MVVEDVLSEASCERLVAGAARGGLRYVSETSDGVKIQRPRDYRLCVLEDSCVADELWRALRGAVDLFAKRKGRRATGLNRRLRVLSYGDGETFDPHFDYQVRTNQEETLLTILVYLTDFGADFMGGETFFLDSTDPVKGPKARIEPKRGRCLLFEHELYHVGAPVQTTPHQRGKFVLRSDLSFATTNVEKEKDLPPLLETPPTRERRIRDFLGPRDHHLREALENLGLLDVSVQSEHPGREGLKEMLSEFSSIPQADLERFLETAFRPSSPTRGVVSSQQTPAYLQADIRSAALDLDSWRPASARTTERSAVLLSSCNK